MHEYFPKTLGETGRLFRNRGVTLIEMLIVIAVIAILAVLAAVAIPQSIVAARAVKSLRQLATIGWALDQYRFDHRNCYPPMKSVDEKGVSVAWTRNPLADYLPLRPGDLANPVFICPNAHYEGYPDSSKLTRTYAAAAGMIGLNAAGTGTSELTKGRQFFSLRKPAATILVCDARQSGATAWCETQLYWSQANLDLQAGSRKAAKYIDYRQNGKAHFLFADGHVEALTPSAAKDRITFSVWTGIE